MSWSQFRESTTAASAQASWDHVSRSHCLTIDKSARSIGYSPRYQPEVAVLESIGWLVEHGQLTLARPLLEGL